MTDKATLMALAERVEKASGDDQRELLIEAFKAIHGQKPHRPSGGSPEWLAWLHLFNPFFKKLEARAFLDAAMSLVPEGYIWMVTNSGLEHPTKPDFTRASAVVAEWESTAPMDDRSAATPALALTAASLRAIANKEPTK